MKGSFGMGWLLLDESLLLHEVDAFRDYILKSEKSILEVQAAFEKKWDEQILKNADVEDDLHEVYHEEISKTFKLLPNIAFSSLYISLSSFSESSIKKAGNTVSHPTLKWRDMAGYSDFEKIRTFLLKVALVDLSPIENAWQRVLTFNKLRNLIVHHSNLVEVDDNDIIKEQVLRDLFKQYPSSLTLESWGKFFFKGTEVLLDFLEAIKDLIIKLFEVLKQRLIKMYP